MRYHSYVSEQIISSVGVLDKAMAIVDAVVEGPLSLNSLAERTGFHRATAHRLAVALEAHGLLRRDLEGRFTLGGRFVELGRVAGEGLPLVDASRSVLVDLVAATGESAQLYVRAGDQRVCVLSLESSQGLRTTVPVGAVLPLNRGSAGRALLGEEDLGRRGWIESVAEREKGVASVSAPIFDLQGVIRGAVSVSGPIERTSRTPGVKYGARVARAARSIEQAVGWTV
jgi:DNA-binding IclR family transcriptional regulator